VSPRDRDDALRARVKRLAAQAREHDLDALLITGPVNVRYVSGFTGTSAAVLVAATGAERRGPPGRGGRHLFITDFRYATQAAEQVGGSLAQEIVSDNLLEGVAAQLGAGGGRIGFLEKDLAVSEHTRLAALLGQGWQLVASASLLEAMRAVKDGEEIERMRAAAQLADEALAAVLEQGLVGRSERDVALELELQMRRRGAEGASFAPIVAAGAHGALPHAEARDVEIPPDVLLTIDWGALHEGYCSDCTRTYATGEDVGGRAREIHELVLRAQQSAADAVRAGEGARTLDGIARELIAAAGYGERFGHGLGHGVGMEVHEGPRLSRTVADEPLVAGNVVTVEPGVYLPGELGVRIEDLLVVTDEGHEVLTRQPKELAVIA
jgi:Xaa-Pro aminopeptidase